MNDLQNFFANRKTADINKWSNYFDLYEHYLCKYRNRPVHFLEIGVDRGGSSKMWKTYFGREAVVVGIDIVPECKKFENPAENRFVEIGDQSDPVFLQKLIDKYEYFDVILDDGSHIFEHQIKSLEVLWNALSDNGIYMIEDVHTSYSPSFNGGVGESQTFIEYSKKIIDSINSWHFLSQPNKHFKNSVYGLYFHSGVVVLEKHSIDIPVTFRSGEKTFRNAIEEFKYSHTYISSSSFLKFVSWIVRYIFYSIAGNRNKKSLFKTHLKYWRLLKKN